MHWLLRCVKYSELHCFTSANRGRRVCANARSARMDANRGCNKTIDLYHIFLVRRTFREEKVYSNNLLHSVAKTNRSLNTLAVGTLPNTENAITHHQLGSIHSVNFTPFDQAVPKEFHTTSRTRQCPQTRMQNFGTMEDTSCQGNVFPSYMLQSFNSLKNVHLSVASMSFILPRLLETTSCGGGV